MIKPVTMGKRCLILSTLLVCSLQLANSIDTWFPSDSVQSLGIGGSPVFMDGDLYSILRNPAGYLTEPLQTFTEITLYADGPARDVASVVAEGIVGNPTEVFASPAVQSILNNVYAGINAVGPLAFGVKGDGIALAVVNDTYALAEETSPLTLNIKFRESLMVAGGFSIRVPLFEDSLGDLYAGCVVKAVVGGEFVQQASFLQIPGLLSEVSASGLQSFPFSMATGFGVNCAVEYRLAERMSVRVLGEDVISGFRYFAYDTFADYAANTDTPEREYVSFPMQLHVGFSFSPELGRLGRFITDLTFFTTYEDMLDFLIQPAESTNPVLHLSSGLDCEVMDRIHIRTGIGQGLLSAGLGIELASVALNASVYGREYGSQPGMRPVFGAAAGVAIRR